MKRKLLFIEYGQPLINTRRSLHVVVWAGDRKHSFPGLPSSRPGVQLFVGHAILVSPWPHIILSKMLFGWDLIFSGGLAFKEFCAWQIMQIILAIIFTLNFLCLEHKSLYFLVKIFRTEPAVSTRRCCLVTRLKATRWRHNVFRTSWNTLTRSYQNRNLFNSEYYGLYLLPECPDVRRLQISSIRCQNRIIYQAAYELHQLS